MRKRMLPDRDTQVRFLQFLVAGGSAALVQFGSLALLKRRLTPVAAFSIAFFCSTTTHYTLNRFWALRSGRRDSGRQFLEYLATVAFSYLINVAVFKYCNSTLGLSVMEAAVLAVPPSTLGVFLLLHYWVFRKTARAAPPADSR